MNELDVLRRRVEELEKALKLFMYGDKFRFPRDIYLQNGIDLHFGAGDGTKIGAASTHKLAFWGVTPVDQPATVSDPTVGTVSGSGDDTNINTNFTNIRSAVVSVIDRLQESGLIA